MSVLKETRNTTFLSIQNHSKETHILDNNLRDDHVTLITLVNNLFGARTKILSLS